MEMEELVIVIKAYRSAQDRTADKDVLETHEFKTVKEFDEVVSRLYSEGRYVVFSGKSGVKLASRDAARLLLLKAEEREKKIVAILLCTAWLSKNRPDLDPYLSKAVGHAVENSGEYLVTIGIEGPNGYEAPSFDVDLETEEVKPR